MARVQVRFDGVSTGAKRAANETRAAVKGVGDQADRDTKRISLMGPALRRTFALATVGLTLFAGASVVAFKKSVDAASNLTEQVNKARVVFRGAEKEVIAWSQTTSKSIGISQRAALEFAGVFGNMLVPMGFARKEAAQMSTQLVELAADMASFNNADPTEVLEALRAGLAGETEPLRRFGIFLNEARIKQEALNAGLVKGKEELTSAGKAASIYRIILKDTGDAQGDFARTSDSLANSQRTTKAVLEDVAARIGAVFLPAVTSASNALNKWLQDEDNVRMLERWAETLEEGVATALRGIADWVRDHRAQIVDFFRETAEFAGDAAGAIGLFAKNADAVAKTLGGWDDAFKLIVSAALAAKLARLLGILGGTGGTGKGGILGMMNRLKGLGPVTLIVALAMHRKVGDTFRDLAQGHVGELIEKKWGVPTRPEEGSRGVSGMQLPTQIKSTHQTSGLEGFPAVDIFANAGSNVKAPEDGRITRVTPFNPNPAFFGQGIYFVGEQTGSTYYIKHVVKAAKPGRYRKGDVIALVARGTAGGDHVHLGIKQGAGALAAGDESGGDYEAGETTAATSTADTGTSTKKAGIDDRDLGGARSTARFINKHLESIASPTLRARIRQRGLAIADALADVTDPKEFARIRRNLNALERDFENAVKLTAATKQAQATARSISSALGNMPEALQRELAPKVERLNRELGNVTSKRQLDRIRKDLEQIQAAIKAALEKMQRTVEQRRDAFGAAFGKVADKAMQIFDARTDELIRKARAKVGGELLGEGELGPAGRALRDFRAEREAARIAADRAARIAELSTAKAEETEEEKAERLRQLAAYHAEIALEDREAELERAATLEETAAAAALEAERNRIRDERAILKERFQARYDEIVGAFQREEITAEEAQQRLLALLADPAWAADFANAGTLIGAAFAASFTEALSGVAAAVRELREAIKELADATGEPMPGETPWERALRLRSEAENRRHGLGDRMLALARGGRVPGRYVGRADTVMARVTPGEEILDRSLSRDLRAFLAGGSRGSSSYGPIYVLGTSEREVAQALRRIVDGAPPTVGYSNPS